MKFLRPYAEQSYALMRIVVGLVFMQYGLPYPLLAKSVDKDRLSGSQFRPS